jgi:hypothetical protein
LPGAITSTDARIRARIQKTVEDIIEVGNDLQAVKETLAYGLFLPWLRAKFGWSERSAENFRSTAKRFGPRTASIVDSKLGMKAASPLVAPPAPAARHTPAREAD